MSRFARPAIRYGLALLMVVFVSSAFSQEPTTPPADELSALEARANRFLETVSMDQAQVAYTELLAGSPLARQAEALKALIEKTDGLDEKYGKYRSFERIRIKPIGRELVLLRYLYKCENFPVVWYFTFYRTTAPGETGPAAWRVVTVRFDTNLERLGETD